MTDAENPKKINLVDGLLGFVGGLYGMKTGLKQDHELIDQAIRHSSSPSHVESLKAMVASDLSAGAEHPIIGKETRNFAEEMLGKPRTVINNPLGKALLYGTIACSLSFSARNLLSQKRTSHDAHSK